MTYGAETTQPTVEDDGRAQLNAGSGTVVLAGDFRQTIEGASDYLVFLTPRGDTNGLYIASQNANGFVVRESHGGRSSIAFDYRIVAQRYGMKTGRLPHYAMLHPELASRGVRPDGGLAAAVRHPSIPAIATMPTRSMLAH